MAVKLTKREFDVLMRAGFSDADTANQLGLAPTTVRVYWISVFKKLQAHGKAHAAIKAMRLDLISKYQFIV
jgi:DNA-binding NarL/FixJ family response regulator